MVVCSFSSALRHLPAAVASERSFTSGGTTLDDCPVVGRRRRQERAEEAAEVTQFLAGYRLGPEHRPVEKESTEGKGLECTGVTYAGSRSISPYWRVCLSMCFFNVRMCTCS